MNHQVKRYRQINLFESFASTHKKIKFNDSSDMNINQEMRELIASAAEKRIASTSAIYNKEVEENTLTNKESRDVESTDSDDSVQIASQNSNSASTELFVDETDSEDQPHLTSSNCCANNSLSCTDPSQELFTDYEDVEKEDKSEKDDEVRLSFLNKAPACCLPLPKLEPLENHSIMFSPHIRDGVAPRPYPSTYRDKWDDDHVRMPCSPCNRCSVENVMGGKRYKSRWDLICRSLSSEINSSKDLEKAIMKYNSYFVGRWNFGLLHSFFDWSLNEEDCDHFFEDILPKMVEMALNLPNICTQPIPLLKQQTDHCITMSQKQIGCLLLNAFFCTFPFRNLPGRNNKQRWNYEFSRYPEINFSRLFNGTFSQNAEKLKCLLNYFKRIVTREPSGTVTFHRQCLENLPEWHKSTCGLRPVVIKSDGLIEVEGHGMLQVDFANKYIGGGVLGQGCVQEEILFVVYPELIVSRLFVECLGPNEAVVITGAERYNKYSGYSETFKWEGNFEDETPRDSWGRKYTQIVAIDALSFRNAGDQYKPHWVERELNKAYCGFYEENPKAHLSSIATGNWGCGAFKGNPHLKFVIQMMAASQAGRSIVYFTFGSENLAKDLKRMYKIAIDKNLSVGNLWRLLETYCENVKIVGNDAVPSLPDFMQSTLTFRKHVCNSHETLDCESSQNEILKLVEELSTDIEESEENTLNDPT